MRSLASWRPTLFWGRFSMLDSWVVEMCSVLDADPTFANAEMDCVPMVSSSWAHTTARDAVLGCLDPWSAFEGARTHRLPHRVCPPLLLGPARADGKQLDVRVSAATVELFHRGVRVASHIRSRRARGLHHRPKHMPASHREYARWTPRGFANGPPPSAHPNAHAQIPIAI